MTLGSTGRRAGGAPGRAERFRAGTTLTLLVGLFLASAVEVAPARMDPSDRGLNEQAQAVHNSRVYQFYGWYHSVGQLLLHVSNLGYFGDWDADLTAPSAEWPAGSGHEYLYAGGIWVGGIVLNPVTGLQDTLVSAAVYQQEFRPDPDDLSDTIFETWEGAANSIRLGDDDNDCVEHLQDPLDPFEWFDEDPFDGVDNDDDGLTDEDYAAISQQMYTMKYEDTYEEDVNENAPAGDEHTSMGLRVMQQSYQWTSDLTDDFVGIQFTVVNIGVDTIKMAYVGFMVDADAGPLSDEFANYLDDRGGFIDTSVVSVNPNDPTEVDTLSMSIAYMYDDPYGEDGNVAKGYFGCMFLGHPTAPAPLPGEMPDAPTEVRVHAFEIWSSGTEDPNHDRDRYRYLRGAVDYPLYNGIDDNNNGIIDEPEEWLVNIDRNADSPQDWRFMLSAGPWAAIVPGDTLSFQYAFVIGPGLEGMLENAATAQQIYNGIWQDIPNCAGEPESVLIHWVADTPPPPPNQEVTAGGEFVRLEWDDYPEFVEDPLTRVRDFYGYQVWKAVGWDRESGEPKDQDWQLILDIDRSNNGEQLDEYDTGLNGIGKYTFVDENVKSGFNYWYSVTAYDSTAEGFHFGKYSQNKTRVIPHSDVRSQLDEIRVVPNPYVNHPYMARWNLVPDDTDPTGEKLCFQNLPRDSVVKIFSLGGELVQTLRPNAESAGGDACWDMVSRNDQIVVSGVYLYHVDSPIGEKIGKFVIIK